MASTVPNSEGTQFKKGDKAVSESGRKGGINSGIAKRKKKRMSELAAAMLNSALDDKAKEKLKKQYGDILDDDITVASAMMAGQIQSAMRGNSQAFSQLMVLTDKEEERADREEAERKAMLNGTYHMDLYNVPDNFHSVIRDIRDHKHLEYVFKGGRGSTKSSTIAQMIVELIKNNHDIHAVVCRKVGNTLKDSVYSKLKWAIEMQGLSDEFEYKKSPLEIIYKPTGQTIFFRGLDQPEKVKSIAPTFGYIGILWLEELDQYAGDEEIRNVTQSVIRGGDVAWIFKSFNPPKTANNWANKYVLEPKENRVVHSSTYKDVPQEWLGQPFIDEAEHLKEVNPDAYEHEYEGVPNGNGGNVFEYLEIREITDEEIQAMDRIVQGADWGFFPDPFAFVRTHYDADRETIFIMDELYKQKWSNAKSGQWILDKGYDDYTLPCDSAEPKSINDFKDMGIPAKGAKKGAGSVEYGFKFLQTRKIVVDPNRTPNAYKELTEYEYERDKDGNVISGYPDGNDHILSALRYAYEPYFNKRGTSA